MNSDFEPEFSHARDKQFDLMLSESDSSYNESADLQSTNTNATTIYQDHDSTEDIQYGSGDVHNQLKDSEEIAREVFHKFAEYKSQMEQMQAQIHDYIATKRRDKDVNIQEMLIKGGDAPQKKKTQAKKRNKSKKHQNVDETDVLDWEEVQVSNIPQQDLQIVVKPPKSVIEKYELDMIMVREVNKLKRERQVVMHKVHVLCWIAHGVMVNRILNDQEVLATALSLVLQNQLKPKTVDLKFLKQFTIWYKDIFTFKENPNENVANEQLKDILLGQIESGVITDKKYLVLIFVAMLRALGLQCRVMFNFVAVPIKPPSSQLWHLSTQPKVDNRSKAKDESSQNGKTNRSKKVSKKPNNKSKYIDENNNTSNIVQVDNSGDDDIFIAPTRKTLPRKAKTVINYSDKEISKKGPNTTEKPNQSNETGAKSDSADNLKVVTNKHRKTRNAKNHVNVEPSFESNEVYMPEETDTLGKDSDEEFKLPPKCLRPKPPGKNVDRVKSKSDAHSNKSDVWCEVYVENLEEWVPVDVVKGTVHCVSSLYIGASRPVRYVVGWDNDNYMKDLTKRYVPNWYSDTRGHRVDDVWWAASISPWVRQGPDSKDKRENELLNKTQDARLPNTFAGYKNHPLYALKRHLLMYEALYPADTEPIGYVRGEAVYPRANVHGCNSRTTWLKDAKVVKKDEIPYKVVQSRPIWSHRNFETRGYGRRKEMEPGATGIWPNERAYKSSFNWQRFQRYRQPRFREVELFGAWQVADYSPPRAEAGVVPRNRFGYVELFRPCMLPAGTVHVSTPGAELAARRLRVDCAPALVGFAHARRRCSPLTHGFVVCEEHADLVLRACREAKEDQTRKELEDKEARVYGNWKRIIRGLLTRERVKAVLMQHC